MRRTKANMNPPKTVGQITAMAPNNKSLAQSNKSLARQSATKKRNPQERASTREKHDTRWNYRTG